MLLGARRERAAAVTIGAAQTGVVTLSLKAGTYAIVAKASLHATLDTSTPGVTCLLKAGADGDQVDVDLSSSSDDPVALVTTPHVRDGRTRWTLTCASDDDGVTATDARIVALRRLADTSVRWRVRAPIGARAVSRRRASGSARGSRCDSRTTASSASATSGSSWIPLIASTSAQADSKSRAAPIDAVLRHRVPGVSGRDDPCLERDVGAREAIGVAVAVPALVVVADGAGALGDAGRARDEIGTEGRVRFIMRHSSSLSGPGFASTRSGIAILPTSCSQPASRQRAPWPRGDRDASRGVRQDPRPRAQCEFGGLPP